MVSRSSVAAWVALFLFASADAAAQRSLRFYGHGGSPGDNFVFPDRVKIDRAPPSTANFGAGDFTIEFFMRATAAENPNGNVECGFTNNWVQSNIILDNDRFGQPRFWGIGLLDSSIVFAAGDDSSNYTLCGDIDVLDDEWHHVAVDRSASTGVLRIWVDGVLDTQGPPSGGPTGDLRYEASFMPGNFCSPDGGSGNQSCINSDPFIVFGAEKHGFQDINYSGYLDEVRISRSIVYTVPFTPTTLPFSPLPDTVALYHFDESAGNAVIDATGGEDGVLFFGGSPPAGPVRSALTPLPEPSGAAGAIAMALCLSALRRR